MLTKVGRPVVDVYLDLLSRAVIATGLVASEPLHRGAETVLDGIGRIIKRPPIPRLNLFAPDDMLGWRLRSNANTVHCDYDIRAHYTTTADGLRRVPECTRSPAPERTLYFLGCSFTFGFCVSDDDTFAARLARDRPVENWAVPGYATTHSYLQLMRCGLLARAANSGGTIICCWFPFHLQRAWRRRSWLALLEEVVSAYGSYRGNPLFEIEDAQLVYRGLARIHDAVSDDDDPLVAAMEWRITEELFVEMDRAARSKGVRFVVALLDTLHDGPGDYVAVGDRMRRRLEHFGVASIDVRAPAGERAPRVKLPFHGYPTPLGHRVLAERLNDALDRL